MDPMQVRQSPNPNICASCWQLLEDDSPSLMADIARLPADPKAADQLLDEPNPEPQPKTAQSPKTDSVEPPSYG
jgi:hypothetical protein